ncbi:MULTISPECIES: PAS domain-containing protein [Burkholderia]|uniref:PAS domain-containing protein n=1 Tax=Burkholderia TaxID=32008 RepID=UPI0008A31D59|nr:MULTISPECIES: PAS domain-containing protein [Burkholderia]MBJ9682180.1 PAS domain-containing protein [Burkholderia multivorans]MDR8916266.1 putative diguanylate cyclase DgcE [Burkholderia multivorans]MDR8923125.1 putative diguanylate cyclase DgcE [Burkholderia multivorans]MDR8967708.1 putative diguanylate cyclase DgcE [Burkholderia multivorans]MDR8989649.1 putative diguanylate cyclase DgcE [Burkholderia multivorans]
MSEDTFAFRLKVLLEHKKLSLQQVADAVGISRPAVHKWTRGGEIDYSNLRKLAAFLDVNWVWLRYGDDAVKDLGIGAQPELPMTDLRRRYTAEIVSSEARMKHAQEAAGIVTWEWNLVSDELIYSDNCAKLYGREIHSNEEFWDILHPDERSWLNSRALREAIDARKPYVWEFRIVLPDGTVRWIESRTATLVDDAGRPTRMVGTTIDISARKSLEQQLRAQIALLADAERLAGRGAWQWRQAPDEVMVSDEWCRLFGVERDDAPHRHAQVQARVHPDDRAARDAALQEAMAKHGDYRVLYRALLPDGTVRLMLEQGHARPDDEGDGVRVTAMCRAAEPADAMAFAAQPAAATTPH